MLCSTCGKPRRATAADLGLDLKVHTNEEGRADGVTPFTHGAHEYTRIMKTMALQQAFDVCDGRISARTLR